MQPLLANRYRVLAEVGQGGMGTVYRVADTLQGDREIALKTIRTTGAISQELNLRFKEEFRAMARLQHPNTVAVHDFGQLDAQTRYLTMEFVPGQVLADLIRGKRLPLDETYRHLIQLLQALSFIHARQYVHRDIKADNIRIRDDGTLKLMDFGLMEQLGLASNGKVTGTVGYLPPEVPSGGVIGAGADLYSVGCLAFEMITGRLPFGGGIIEVIKAHLRTPPPPLRAYNQAAPQRLEEIVGRLLEKDVARRYQDADAVIADLADLAGVQVGRQNLAQKTSYLISSVVVGRDRELDRLGQALAAAQAGKGRAVFVGAPAGVGKSRLVHELLLHAQLDDMPVLRGQCLETGMAPYEPLRQALRPLLALSDAVAMREHGPVLTRLFPELIGQGVIPAAPLEATLEKQRLAETCAAWLKGVATHTPLVLFFDDLHWSDQQSLEAFNHLVRALQGHRVLCLATFRNDETPLGSPIWATIEDGLTDYLKLHTFSLPQQMLLLQAMLRDVVISRTFSEFLYDATAGNAFFITELLRSLVEERALVHRDGRWEFPVDPGGLTVPTRVEDTVLRRLSHASPQARDLVRTASVLGRYQDLAGLQAISGLDDEPLFTHLEELIERQFLIRSDDGLTFPHDRVREALYAAIPEAERRALHLRCGEMIEKRHLGSEDRVINELAYHYSRGEEGGKAYRFLRSAGDQAKVTGQDALAIDYWRQAEAFLGCLDLPDKEAHQVDLWWDIGSNGFILWPAVAADMMDRARPILEAQANVDRVCRIFKRVVALIKRLPQGPRDRILAGMVEPEPYRHQVRRGLRRWLPPPLATWVPRMLECYALLGAANGYAGRPIVGRSHSQRALDLLPFTGFPLEGAVRVSMGGCQLAAGHFDALAETCDRSRQLLFDRDLSKQGTPAQIARSGTAAFANAARTHQGFRFDADLLAYAVWCTEEIQAPNFNNATWAYCALWPASTGRYDEAMALIDLITQNCRRIGAPPFPFAFYLRAYLFWQRGEFDEALSQIQQALRLPHIESDIVTRHLLQVLKGQVLTALGDHPAAQAELAATERFSRDNGLELVLIQTRLAQGHLLLANGDPEAAQAASAPLSEAYSLSAAGPTRNPLHQAIAARLLGTLAVMQGDRQQAQARYAEALAIVTLPDQDNLVEQGHLHRQLGELHLAGNEPAAAYTAFRQAAEVFHRLQNRHLLRPVLAHLESLRQADDVGLAPLGLPDLQPAHASILTTKWQQDLASSFQTIATDEQLYQAVLTSCLEAVEADEAAFYRVDPGPRWVAGTDRAGNAGELPVNTAFLEQVCQDGRGLVAIDMPAEFTLGTDSQLSLEIPSVALAPVTMSGQVRAILYLTRRDLCMPLAETDLVNLSAFSELLSQHLGERLLRT